MNAPPATLLVSVDNPVVCVKISGRANFTSSVDFKTLVNELWEEGRRFFALDLTDCLIMDSTFLGVLAGISVRLANAVPPNGAPHLILINPNSRIAELLDTLGVAHLFKTITSAEPVSGKFEAPATSAACSRDEISRTCLEAHQTLMHVNPGNVPRFQEVAQFLAEKLKKPNPGPY
ncbi:MAG: STAS domain-containing protein [Verrucomicrobia bacterium]|nr:STAS domain-containing protein [Verrucomicrobiota bacterium]